MTKPRTLSKASFPFQFAQDGRQGKIYKLGNGTFKTYFLFGGKPKQNTHANFEAAFEYLEREFSVLDTEKENSLALHPLDRKVQDYHELEQLLKREGDGASLRDAVEFYIANRMHKRFEPKTVAECSIEFLASQRTNGVTEIHAKTLAKHFRRFERSFGTRKIHEISTLEIDKWLGSQTDEDSKKPWSVKTRKSVRASLVSLAIYAQSVLKAIPSNGKTEFQNVRTPKKENKAPVEIYTPDDLKALPPRICS